MEKSQELVGLGNGFLVSDNQENDTALDALIDPVEYEKHTVSSERTQGISECEAGASLAKAIMGAGSFALPWVFSKMGYIAGPCFLCMLMALSVCSLQILLLSSRSSGKHSYVEVARTTFGTMGARLTYAASVSASLGVCGSYLVFIASNIQSLLEHMSGGSNIISQSGWVFIVLPLAVLLSSVRDMKHFAFASLLGDISVVLGMAVVVFYGVMYNTSDHQDVVAFGSINEMPLAFGAMSYLFLVHFLVLPIESSMAHPERFYSVSVVTFSACAVLSGSFGAIGYLLFGSSTNPIVLLNVQGSLFVSAVKVLLCIDLLLTYPVVMRPTIVIVEQSLQQATPSASGFPPVECDNGKCRLHTPRSEATSSTRLLVCSLLGLVAASSSLFVPSFGLLSGLVGGVSQTFLAFVLPPLMLARQRSLPQHPTSLFALMLELPPLHMALTVVGMALIVWTLLSTWQELSSG
eukprot:Nitzschia sp. Nitz4//scaffold134_size62860//30009//31400//NITZ4_006327-RA/size62860-processed-gene-0.32-mRNA-1//1//CDS//3329535493//9027//frame0